MTGFTSQGRRATPGDPLDDLLDDTPMRRSGARARPRVSYAPSGSPGNVWFIALVASVIWTAAVIAFSWARFSLPGDPRVVLDAAGNRLGFADWMMILSVIIGPLLLIWVIAWLVRRSVELRDESRRLAKAAVLLADAAENAEKRAERMLPAPDSPAGELIAMGPGHLHREIERANHAMSALQTQMSTMETALAKQAAAFDNAAERAAERSRALTSVTAGAVSTAAMVPGETDSSDAENSTRQEEGGADEASQTASAIDLTLSPEPAVDVLRTTLREAAQSAGWKKLVEEDTAPPPPPPSSARSGTEDTFAALREDVAVIQTPPPIDVAPPQPPQVPQAVSAMDQSVDPFDDLGPSTPKAVVGAAIGAGIATMSFGASRNDEPSVEIPSLGAPSLDEPAPAPAVALNAPPPSAPAPQKEDFEFMPRALDWEKFVRAANFPENERDTATLDALYDVLTDTEAAALLQSSEDTLATLADIDLYMEDFKPEMSSVAAWRGHLEGREGVNPIEAPVEQSRITAKITADDKFRKLSERFVERYLVMVKRLFVEGADDKLVVELSDTRTGRAYLLMADALGRL